MNIVSNIKQTAANHFDPIGNQWPITFHGTYEKTKY